MPNHQKTLTDMIRQAGQQKARDTDFIPSVFSKQRIGNFNEVAVKTDVYPLLKDQGYFWVPYGATDQAIAERAMAYGSFLAGREKYVPYTLDTAFDQGWCRNIRMAVGASLMADFGIGEMADRDAIRVLQSSVYNAALDALGAIGTPQQGAAFTEDAAYMKARGHSKQAVLLKPILEGIIAAAKEKVPLDSQLKLLQELYGTEEQQNPAQEKEEPEEVELEIEDFGDPEKSKEGTVVWGAMEELTAPLVNRIVRSKKKSKVWKRADVGAFRYPWRALKTSDLQCFAVKRRTYGGTLLFDMSGSMRLTPDQIRTVLERSPEASIAAYGSTLGSSNQRGRLVTIAKDGMAANHETVRAMIGMGNVVDGPALRWLASQPEPRIWVSDGKATGKKEDSHQGYYDEAQRLRQAGRIHQIPDADTLIKMLTS